MPEIPEVLVWERLLNRKSIAKHPFYLLISPLAFSLGSEKRKYTTLTARKGTYNLVTKVELPPWVLSQRKSQSGSWPPKNWRDRAVNEDWEYLLEDTPPSPLICRRRGKVLVVACGHHAMVISFGLEAHLRIMAPEVFWKIIKCDVAGPNKDPEKGQKMRTFLIPDEFIVKGSSETHPRSIRILAAFISERYVIVLCDFCGLARMHIESRFIPWTKKDFEVGTESWEFLFRKFKGGPDWIIERELAEKALENWRKNVIKENAEYQAELEDINQMEVTEPPPPTPAPAPLRSMIKEICANSGGAFSGLGRHLANDICFHLAIHPATPAIYICQDNKRFAELLEGIPEYLGQFTKPGYYQPMEASCGLGRKNPFEFHEDANRIYMHSYVDVFRRCNRQVPEALYVKYLKQGLLDPQHIIGQPYDSQALDNFFKTNASKGLILPEDIDRSPTVNVYFIGHPLKAFTIIRAQVPQGWMPPSTCFTAVKTDLAEPNYKTTVGPTQFRELVLNRIIQPTVNPKGGRPAKDRNGSGRPRKSKPTIKSIKNSAPQIRRRVIVSDEPDGEPSDSDDDYNPGDADEDGDIEAALETPWRWSLPKHIMEDQLENVGLRLDQVVQVGTSLLDYLPFILEAPEVQNYLDFKSDSREMAHMVPKSKIVIQKSKDGSIQIVEKKKRIRSSTGQTQPEFYSKEDIIHEARNVVIEESPYLDFNICRTALNWAKGELDYHLAKAILDKGDAITDANIAPFLAMQHSL